MGARSVTLRALSTVFRLTQLTAENEAQLSSEWTRCLVPDGAEDVLWHMPDPDFELGLEYHYAMVSAITRQAVERLHGAGILFHAAGLATQDGRVIAVIAPSGTGKTTAALTLCREHFGYVTDEVVAINPDHTVVPFPKPLSIIHDEASPDAKRQYGPAELGLRACPARLRIHRLVVLERCGDPSVPRLTPLGYAEALLEIIPQTMGLLAVDKPLQRLCELLDRCGGVHRLSYAEIGASAGVLHDLLDQEIEVDAWQPLRCPSEAPTPHATHYLQAPVADAVMIGEEALLMVDGTPTWLSPIGLTVWTRAATPATFADLVAAAIHEHGEHPHADELVSDAVRIMVDARLLTPPSRERELAR